MQKIKINSLKILSNPQKTGNQFKFHEKLNLITAADNSVGKSTLVKLLMWAFGCDPTMDTTWKAQDCQTIISFSIDTITYEIFRYKNLITLKDSTGTKFEFTHISGDYSKKMAEILSFKALLPNKNESAIETPPPAYFFLPFYIDQKKSWTTAWENFEKLHQYSDWKSTIIKYHVGLLPPSHFEKEKAKFEKKIELSEANHLIEKFSTAIEVVNSYTPEINSTISEEKFQEMTEEIRNDLKTLSDQQEKVLDDLAKSQSEKSYLENQVEILKSCVAELSKDYTFAYEHVDGELLECPLCATHYDNSVFNKTSILTDRDQAQSQLESTELELEAITKKYAKATKNYEDTRTKIVAINEKYYLKEDNEQSKTELKDIIENIAGNSIKQQVVKAKGDKLSLASQLSKDITDIGKEQKKLLLEEERKQIMDDFVLYFTKYTTELSATAINMSEINSPLDYVKVVKEGGAAESTRAILAYYLAIFSLIAKTKNQVLAPFIIDTPNQQEQSLGNYDKIIELIFSVLSENTQVFMCAMENSLLAPFQENGTVITLDSNKILQSSCFLPVSKEFAQF